MRCLYRRIMAGSILLEFWHKPIPVFIIFARVGSFASSFFIIRIFCLSQLAPEKNLKMAEAGWDFTYDVNTNVEVIGTEKGHLGSFYEVTIEARITQSHYDVKYLFLVDADEGLPLIERFPVGRLRPIPPNEYVRRYELGDEVDCEWRDGYWFGRMIGFDVAENMYYVKFPLTADKLWAHHSRLRAHFDWTGERFSGQPKFNYML